MFRAIVEAVARGLFLARPPTWGTCDVIQGDDAHPEVAQWALDVDEIERQLAEACPKSFDLGAFRMMCGR